MGSDSALELYEAYLEDASRRSKELGNRPQLLLLRFHRGGWVLEVCEEGGRCVGYVTC